MMNEDKACLARISLLHDCTIHLMDGQDVTPVSKKTRGLLAFLALSPDGVTARKRLADLVWSTRGEKQARDSLRQALATIRGHLGNQRAPIVSADRERVVLHLDRVWVDARELERFAASDAEGDWARIPELYRGDLLESLDISDPCFSEWLLIERMRLRDLATEAVEKLLRCRVAAGELDAACQVAKYLIRLDATHEESHRVLMRVYAAKGDTASALRQFQVLRDNLKAEHGVAPSPESEALFKGLMDRGTGTTELTPKPTFLQVGLSGKLFEVPIAVLPFDNKNTTDDADNFGESITQGIVTALSRFRWLMVIGQNATRGLIRDRADVLEISRRLEVDYILDGSVWRDGDQVRITVELIQCATARTIWADHFNGQLHDLFEAQDRVAAEIAGRLDPQILLAETAQAWRRPLDDTDAKAHVMRAIPLIYRMSPESVGEANKLLKTAIAIEPNYASAYSWRAFWQLINIGQQWAKDMPAAMEEIDWLTRVAIERDPEDALALALRGHVEAFIHHNYEQAQYCFDRALRLNPNLGFAWAFSAVTFCYQGQTQEALRRLQRYRQLSPFDPYPYYFNTAFCIAYTLDGQYEKAAQAGRQVLRENPNYFAAYRPLTASLGHLGEVDEARGYLKVLLQNEPHFSISWLRSKYPPLMSDQFEQYAQGLAIVGVPRS